MARLGAVRARGVFGTPFAVRASSNTSTLGTMPITVPGKRLEDALGRPMHAPSQAIFAAAALHSSGRHAAKMTWKVSQKGACLGRPSASTRRFPGTVIGTVPSVDVFDDVCTAKGVPNAPRDPKRAILDPSSNTMLKYKTFRTPICWRRKRSLGLYRGVLASLPFIKWPKV